jgi:hypothetical protein
VSPTTSARGRRTASDVVVVDVTLRHRGRALVQRLRATGLRARLGPTRESAGGVLVLLLPIVAAGEPSTIATGTIGVLDDAAATGHWAQAPRRVVLAWFVEEAARVTADLPDLDDKEMGHAAHPLLSEAWQEEMGIHDDPYVAAECRSAQLRNLLSGETDGRVDVDLLAEAHRAARRFDPAYLTALCVEVSDGAETTRWRDEASVVAAVHACLPRRAQVFDASLGARSLSPFRIVTRWRRSATSW